MRWILIVTLIAQTAFSQEKSGEEKKKLVFPPPAAPAANPAPSSTDKPGATIDAFFLALKADQVPAAYDALVKDSIIADRPADIVSLKDRTREAIENYGSITGYEVVDEKTVGDCLMRRTCISLNTDLPLRWRFYFYKSAGAWRIVDLRVDDALVDLFEDAVRAKR